ncbi:MAG: nicotinate-nucleotide--dimethylbenzimidazole phosphoribosyltransferase [Desulfovibrionaceae bacterium]|nr:nicotinate-nucleotide--dimethylbenzimidazole phosphoribosyltransferase [Desulfovibrionaceae bacterium]
MQSIASDLEIRPLNRKYFAAAAQHLDNLTKPVGSLGRLEELAKHIYALQSGKTPLSVKPALMYTVAADHGVARQGVSAYPQAVTRQMVENFLQGGGAINVLSRENDLALCLVDGGCVGGPFSPNGYLLDRRLGDGTEDFTQKPAMSRSQAIQGLRFGVELARDAALNGCQCLGVGEMGIGNTTSATAIFSAYLGFAPADITGPGSGIDKDKLKHKISLIEQAITLHSATIRSGDAIDILAALGGFEIAIMAGIMLGGAAEHLLILVDGFISTAAYVVARAIARDLSDYILLTHVSAEPGFKIIADDLKCKPLLDFGLRLGEGTGAALAFPLIKAATTLFNDMATFDSAGVSRAK